MRQLLYSIALFVGAALLFWVQLFTSKMLLPVLGGGAAVWNTCLVFFQVSLLVGYLWAHVIVRWLPGRPGMVTHVVALAAACSMRYWRPWCSRGWWSDESSSEDNDEENADKAPKDASEWVILARDDGDLKTIRADDRWQPLPADPTRRTWTDDYSNVLSTLLH